MRKVQQAKKVDIKAPRPVSNTTESFFTATWVLLKQAIQQIYAKKSSDLSYEELYRSAYKIVLNRHGELLYNNVETCMREHIDSLMSDTLRRCSDELFLKTICNVWEEYKTETSVISSVLMYLNTNYVQKQQQQQIATTSSAQQSNVIHTLFIYDHGVELFKKMVIYQYQSGDKIRKIILDCIEKERNGESVDRLLLKKTVRMLCEMNCYPDIIEEPLMETSSVYFSRLSRELLSQASVTDYLKLVDDRLRDEHKRIQYYLHHSSKQKLDHVVRREMITQHLNVIMESSSGFLSFIKDDKISEMQRMYNLFVVNEKEHLSVMISLYNKYISEYGTSYILDEQKIQGSPVAFVEGLLEQKRKYDKITSISFNKNEQFVKAQKDGIATFADGTKQKRLAEFLSLYVDSIIKNSGTSASLEQELDSQLEEALELFEFLRDKDIFETYYKVHLAKRLLSKSHQAQSEKLFILKLKKKCGYSFTSKIEGMFNDMRLSTQANEQYQQHKAFHSKPSTIDFYVNILTHSFWPAYTLSNANLPLELNQCCDSFTQFYNDVHNGRKVTWQKSLGDGILVSRFPSGKHELVASTFQIAILMLFNDQTEYTYSNIRELTQIPEKELKKNLTILCMSKSKILLKEPKTKNLEDSHKFVYNNDFKSANYRVKLALTSTKESEEEVQETESKIEVERKPVIESVIVRVMKARKKLHHNDLVEEVVKQLLSKFKPNPVEIKRRIENLIEREFLTREEEDHKIYHYVA
ncbi:hypothetical protein C9374_007764 [Naegleria lovaniensis]|uniref:Cullin family profile domain-containing protein n=1 Tax=Naegleria lovaniensis TaxID=51637 RepID=A0AA88GL42_NAELO|nr:uncharacterized protein C9374_007764 [Naegleria lovaniensis]KAG2379126.1 hypothetical protein C9374_007764 [Naegleria lovaniensis]